MDGGERRRARGMGVRAGGASVAARLRGAEGGRAGERAGSYRLGEGKAPGEVCEGNG